MSDKSACDPLADRSAVLPLRRRSRHIAHHSFAMYDQTKQETYTGKLIRFIPGANHAQLLFEIVGADGKPQSGADGKPITWGVELPRGDDCQAGRDRRVVPSRHVITVTLNPLRNGKTFGALAQGRG